MGECTTTSHQLQMYTQHACVYASGYSPQATAPRHSCPLTLSLSAPRSCLVGRWPPRQFSEHSSAGVGEKTGGLDNSSTPLMGGGGGLLANGPRLIGRHESVDSICDRICEKGLKPAKLTSIAVRPFVVGHVELGRLSDVFTIT